MAEDKKTSAAKTPKKSNNLAADDRFYSKKCSLIDEELVKSIYKRQFFRLNIFDRLCFALAAKNKKLRKITLSIGKAKH